MCDQQRDKGEELPGPAPCGEKPQPAAVRRRLASILAGTAAVTVAGAVVVYCCGSRPLAGALRSSRLKAQARQAVIDKAAAEEPPAPKPARETSP